KQKLSPEDPEPDDPEPGEVDPSSMETEPPVVKPQPSTPEVELVYWNWPGPGGADAGRPAASRDRCRNAVARPGGGRARGDARAPGSVETRRMAAAPPAAMVVSPMARTDGRRRRAGPRRIWSSARRAAGESPGSMSLAATGFTSLMRVSMFMVRASSMSWA